MARRRVHVEPDSEVVQPLDRLADDAHLQEAYRRIPQEAWLIEAADQLALETLPEW